MRFRGLRRMVRSFSIVGGALLLALACTGTSADVEQLFSHYAAASASHDLRALEALASDSIVWQFGPHSLEGKEAALEPHAYDRGAETTLEFRNVRIDGNVVEFELIERSEVIRAVGMTELRHYPRFTFENGLVVRKEPSAREAPAEYSMAEFMRKMSPLRRWIRERHPEALPKLRDSDGRFVFSEESGALMLLLTREWVAAGAPGQVGSPILEGPYLGQAPPGRVPEVFAPGIVSTELYSYGGTFTPDMAEFYFRRDGGDGEIEFVVFRSQGGRWHETVLSRSVGQPFIAPNGKTMHLGGSYKERTPEGWSEIKSLGPAFEEIAIMRLTASSLGTYVFDEVGSAEGDGRIRYSRLVEGERQAPSTFGEEINTGTFSAHPFIAPDESYLIWDGRREDGYGDSDIYISFRQADGSWGSAINLGPEINTDGWDAAASVTPDGRYLFFHRLNEAGNANIYWVDAQVIEDLRSESLQGEWE